MDRAAPTSRPPEPTIASGHGLAHQRARDLVPLTRPQALGLKPPGPFSQRPWDPALHTRRKIPVAIKPQFQSAGPAHPLAGYILPWDQLGSGLDQHEANRSFKTPQIQQPNWLYPTVIQHMLLDSWALQLDSRIWLCPPESWH